MELVRCERDWGPATKLLGCLPRLRSDACLIVVDDDMVYRPFLVERLHEAQVRRRDASFSFFVERLGRLRWGQGADGFSFWTPNLTGIEGFAAAALRSPHLFVADDLWISLFLQNRRVAIASLQHTLAEGEFVWERSHAKGQLSQLAGELSRPKLFRKGTSYLLGAGLIGWRLRVKYWLSMIEGSLQPARRLALRCQSGGGEQLGGRAAGVVEGVVQPPAGQLARLGGEALGAQRPRR